MAEQGGMTKEQVREAFSKVRTATRGDRQAPHKPLLLLYVLGRIARGESGEVSFQEADEALQKLLRQFGDGKNTTNTHEPFWRLQNGGVWEVVGADELDGRSKRKVSKSQLLRGNVRGRFPERLRTALAGDKAAAKEATETLLSNHFANDNRSEVRKAVGLD